MTINEMIYKTLTTKITKEPKYKEALEALGYELVKDHDWSEYDYWGIKTAEGKVLVISKGKDNKRHLYTTAKFVQTNDIQKVDFENLIRTDRSATRWWNMLPKKTKTQEYKDTKHDYRIHVSICKDYEKEIAELEQKMADAKNGLTYWQDVTTKTKLKLDEIIAEVRK